VFVGDVFPGEKIRMKEVCQLFDEEKVDTFASFREELPGHESHLLQPDFGEMFDQLLIVPNLRSEGGGRRGR
jgi:hypothetical protein